MKNKMIKLLHLLLAAAMLFLLCACGAAKARTTGGISKDTTGETAEENSDTESAGAPDSSVAANPKNTGSKVINSGQTSSEHIPLYHSQTITDKFGDERVILLGLNVGLDFADDTIFVAIKKRFSEVNKPYYPKDFPQIECAEITNLMKFDNPKTALVNRAKFQQILRLKLKNPGKQNVLNAINALVDNEFVYCAEPNFNYVAVYD